ncbi:MAG TPA: CSLREA domain-containing protein [Candidatus Limnocylindria bacterium]|nr:CSLREA domain-containing protein [Candidatus Limnocylindria bacterium]
MNRGATIGLPLAEPLTGDSLRRLTLAVLLTVAALCVNVPTTFGVGNTIQVNTTADGEFPVDGKCSLAAAIKASNTGASAGYCAQPGTADPDIIHFSLGPGLHTITLAGDLPAITAPVLIDAGVGFGVRITGSDTLTTGLEIQAGPTSIRGLVIDGFVTGIHVSGAAGVTLIGNTIGPNSDAGVLANNGSSNLIVGGNLNVTSSDDCNDECNLISGNTRVGIEAHGGGEIVGNYIGTNNAGLTANPNGIGAIVADGTWTVGGRHIEDRNVISGNTGDGLQLIDCTCTVHGNYIGLKVTGQGGPGNGGDGIDIERPYTTSIGSPAQGSRNLISGNGGNGINVDTDLRHDGAVLTIMQNKIGLSTSNTSLGNGGEGIYIGAFAPPTIVGGTGDHDGNVLAHNAGAGVRVVGADQARNEIRGNSIFSNATKGIALEAGANQSIGTPTIVGASPLHGTACAGCIVDIYSDKADEGKQYQGSTVANGTGQWSYTDPVYGPNATATNTDANGNTSEFSAPFVLGSGGGGGGGDHQPDGRIRKFSGAYVGNDIYNNDGTNQTKNGQARIGYIVEFTLAIENDGDGSDTFKLQVNGGSTTMYRIKYYRGSNDITTKVVDGTYVTPSIAPGQSLLITIDVIVKKGATLGSSISRLVTITSVGDNAQIDAVRFEGARK